MSAAVERDWAEFFQLLQQVLKTVEVVVMQATHHYLTPKKMPIIDVSVHAHVYLREAESIVWAVA